MYARTFAAPMLVALIFILAPLVADALDQASRCEADKLKIASRYGACRLSAESKGIKKGEAPDFSECTDKFSYKWQKTEDKAGPGVCPSDGDESSMDELISDHASKVAELLTGVPPPAEFVNCGDGTIADYSTGLMWANDGPDFLVDWIGAFKLVDTYSLGGHTDWRMPSMSELSSILHPTDCYFPCIHPVFGDLPHGAVYYWSSDFDESSSSVYVMDFQCGPIVCDEPVLFVLGGVWGAHVRAVRTGQCP